MARDCAETAEIGQPATAAVCGLFCSACTFYIGTHEDPARLDRLAEQFGTDVERLYCDGCRSSRRLFYCAGCHMFTCAAKRGLDFCGECEDYPCPELETFVAERPHRADIPRNQARIREIGARAWLGEAIARHACPDCGTLNSAYDLKCRRCGRTPSSPYVGEHHELIVARLPPGRRPLS